jgi:hypothetical protein
VNRERFAIGEFYHIYNRGVDKRDIFSHEGDQHRFLKSMTEFNVIEPIGSLHERAVSIKLGKIKPHKGKLVDIICYCLNPNHYHFILQQKVDGGISEFMKRLGGGYTKYFNTKYKRSGVLFQGVFQSRHVTSNEYLLHLSAYVNLNDKVHRVSVGRFTSKSSWGEYMHNDASNSLCDKKVVLNQFEDIREYVNFAKESLADILERKQLAKELETLLLE